MWSFSLGGDWSRNRNVSQDRKGIVKTIGVIANLRKSHAPDVLKRLGKRASKLGMTVLADGPTARFIPRCRKVSSAALFDGSDAIVAMGGDGTMIRAVRELDGMDKPLIGVNIGSLGFMTSVAEAELERALECLARGDYIESVRAIVECDVIRGKKRAKYRALNDIVIRGKDSIRVVSLDVSIDNEIVTSYACDGLIVATPTGSTGHSLSAGGPIIAPGTQAFVISIICPHSLSSRPLVIPDRSAIAVTISESDGDVLLSVDGQLSHTLAEGDSFVVRRSDASVRFIHLPGHSYFSVLRQKLHWRGSVI